MDASQALLWHEETGWQQRHRWAVPIVERLQAAADGPIDQAWFEAEASEHRWSPATRSLYARALQCAGITVTGPPSPAPWDGPRSLPLLWQLGPRPTGTQLRAAAWARLAAGWPAEVELWHQLDDRDVELEGDDAFVHGRRVLGAGPLWQRWRDWCDQHLPPDPPEPRAALVRVQAADRSAPAGARLSVRGMQDAFLRGALRAATIATEHAVLATRRGDHDRAERLTADAATYRALSYDSYRRLMLQAGAEPVGERARGAVRNLPTRRQPVTG